MPGSDVEVRFYRDDTYEFQVLTVYPWGNVWRASLCEVGKGRGFEHKFQAKEWADEISSAHVNALKLKRKKSFQKDKAFIAVRQHRAERSIREEIESLPA